ncbi:MAG: hypothetical protein ACKPKO_20735, partial [Candidatus Fonsibacter sp.]
FIAFCLKPGIRHWFKLRDVLMILDFCNVLDFCPPWVPVCLYVCLSVCLSVCLCLFAGLGAPLRPSARGSESQAAEENQ